MTQDRAVILVQFSIVALLGFLVAAIILSAWYLIAVLGALYAAVQFGSLHNRGSFVVSMKPKLADRAEERAVESDTTIVPLNSDPVVLDVEDRSSIA